MASDRDAKRIANLNDFDRQVLNTMALLPHEFHFYEGGFIHPKLGQFRVGWLGAQQVYGADFSRTPIQAGSTLRRQPMATRRRLTWRGGWMVKQQIREIMGSAIGDAELESVGAQAKPDPNQSVGQAAGLSAASVFAQQVMQAQKRPSFGAMANGGVVGSPLDQLRAKLAQQVQHGALSKEAAEQMRNMLITDVQQQMMSNHAADAMQYAMGGPVNAVRPEKAVKVDKE